MKLLALLLVAALLSSACAHHPHRTEMPLRRAPGESAEDFADRKQAAKDHAEEVRELRRQNAQDARDQSGPALDSPFSAY